MCEGFVTNVYCWWRMQLSIAVALSLPAVPAGTGGRGPGPSTSGHSSGLCLQGAALRDKVMSPSGQSRLPYHLLEERTSSAVGEPLNSPLRALGARALVPT